MHTHHLIQNHFRKFARNLTAILVMLLLYTSADATTTYIWVEGEDPESVEFEWKAGGATKSHIYSQNQALQRNGREQFPEDGQAVTYALDAPSAGTYQVWIRMGFAGLIPDVRWSIDDGPSTSVGYIDRKAQEEKRQRDVFRDLVNVKELGRWNSIGWMYLGEASLSKGEHKLHLDFLPGRSDKPILQIDAVNLVQGEKGIWVPEGSLKPGERYDGEMDRAAAKQTFQLPAAKADGERTEVQLDGLWQVARYDDPDMGDRPYEPLTALPDESEYPLRWMGVEVPSDLWDKDEMAFGHRAILRTRVDVPASHEGRGFKLHFTGTNWITSVLVNGSMAGSADFSLVPWNLDISDHIEPGKVNEIAVAVKSPWYAFDIHSRPWQSLHEKRYNPRDEVRGEVWVTPVYPMGKGEGDGQAYGIVQPVTLLSTGRAYVEDVFIKPSVRNEELVTDVTVLNKTGRDDTFDILCEAVNEKTGKTEKTFGPVSINVPAGESATKALGGSWADPKLWWPLPDPDLYTLRTTVRNGDEILDVQEELFGFREVTVDGTAIKINGVRRNFWNWQGFSIKPESDEEWAERYFAEGNRFRRFTGGGPGGNSRSAHLEYYDRHGIAGRLSSNIDGMFNSYWLGERNPFKPNELLWKNFRKHIAQMTKAYRNHPSIIFYQIENELVYITGMNVFNAHLDEVEAEMMKVYKAGYANDPTRPYTVGGGGDLRHAKGFEKGLEINDPHYPRGSYDWYPENAFTLERYSNKIERWPWRREKPWVVGESLFAKYREEGSLARGAIAYKSKHDARVAKAAFLRDMYEGYRWAGVAGFFPWTKLADTDDGRLAFADLAAIPRYQSWRLYGGRDNELLYKVMNDTFDDEPVTFSWKYTIDGKEIAANSVEMDIEPGYGQEHTIRILPPDVDERAPGTLILRVTQPGAKEFYEEVDVPTLPVIDDIEAGAPLFVYDKSGTIGPFLQSTGQDFEKVDDLAAFVEAKKSGALLVGPDTLSSADAFGSNLLKFAVRGNQVITLEQEYPPQGANLVAPLRSTQRFGGYAHPQALGTPLFKDFGKLDFIHWRGSSPVYKNAYMKPTKGARSLIHGGSELPYSALVEMPASKGMLVFCQMTVGANLGKDPAADVLLRNLIETYAGAEPSSKQVAVYAQENDLLLEKLRATGIMQEATEDLATALDANRYAAVVVDATTTALGELNTMAGKVQDYQAKGGWLVLHGLEPDAMDAFNRLMETDHILRPFRMERIVMERGNHPLAATLSHADVAYISNKVLARSKGLDWVSWNTMSYCLDTVRDFAPFTIPPEAPEDPFDYSPTWSDRDPYNWVNNLLESDYWKYFRQIWAVKAGETSANGTTEGPAGLTHTFKLRQPEELAEIQIWNLNNYSSLSAVKFIFDGDEEGAMAVTLPDSMERFDIPVAPARRVEKSITLQFEDWRIGEKDNPLTPNLVGIQNIRFMRPELPSEGFALDSVGGLSVFPHGEGGTLVSQIKFMEDEPRQVNAEKKVALLRTLLQNMGAGSGTTTVAVPGVNVRYDPVNITDWCNTYMVDREGKTGWFQRGQVLQGVPGGETYMEDILFHTVDYATAPVPTCIVAVPSVGGFPHQTLPQEIEGIKVGEKADMLFFLQTAEVRRPIKDEDRARIGAQKKPYELPTVAQYVLNYADGESREVDVVLEKHVDHWLQGKPRNLPGARVVWNKPAEGEGIEEGQRQVLYSMRVDNPRPGVIIDSIDLKVPKNRHAGLALLAITLGQVVE